MQIDSLLENVTVHVEAFALCLIDEGWRLRLPRPTEAIFHFVLRGDGVLVGGRGERYEMHPYWLGVVPPGSMRALE
jgi:hypothetical protein